MGQIQSNSNEWNVNVMRIAMCLYAVRARIIKYILEVRIQWEIMDNFYSFIQKQRGEIMRDKRILSTGLVNLR